MKTVFIKCPILSLQCSIVDVSRVLLETENFYILKSWAGNKKHLTFLCFYGLSSTFYDFLCDARFQNTLFFLMIHKREFFNVSGLN